MPKIEGSSLAQMIKEQVKVEVQKLRCSGITPKLVSILCSEDLSAATYARTKEKLATKLGIDFELIQLAASLKQEEVEERISAVAAKRTVHGVLIEQPMRPELDTVRCIDCIPANKDVDGMGTINMGLLASNREREALVPACPQACIELAKTFLSLTEGDLGLIGKGRTVGKPLLLMLLNLGATVAVCGSKTKDIGSTLRRCKTVFVAVGKPEFITLEHLSVDQSVIDAGINVVGTEVVGDVSRTLADKLENLTAVPGGIGPVTNAILFRNLLKAISLQGGYV